MRKAVLVCIFLMFAGFVPTSHADTYYKVTILNITFDGTNACGGQCVETFDGSFELDVFLPPAGVNLDATIVPGSVSFTSSGPLGVLNCCGVNFGMGYIAITGAPLQPYGPDEFDITLIANTDLFGGTGIGEAGIEMYACESATCVADFTSPIGTPCFNCGTGPSSGTVTFSLIPPPVSTPEPKALALLLLAIPALLFWANRRSRFAPSARILTRSSAEPGTSLVTCGGVRKRLGSRISCLAESCGARRLRWDTRRAFHEDWLASALRERASSIR